MTGATFKSKTFWTGMAAIVTGVGLIVMGNVPEGIQTIGGGIVAIFIRDAISKSAK